MCGIAAFAGIGYDPTYFKYIALAQDDRGKHGCGLYFQSPALDYHVCMIGGVQEKVNKVFDIFNYSVVPTDGRKYGNSTSIAELFINEKEVPKYASVAMAHSRKATSGSDSVVNSHPVYWESISGSEVYLVHNGTVHNWVELNNRFLSDDPIQPKSDSQMLAKAIAMSKLEVLSHIVGSATILWVNSLNSRLYAYCSKPIKSTTPDRPIHYINVNGSYYLSSVSGVLNTVAMLATTPELYVKDEEVLEPEIIWEFPSKKNCGAIKRIIPVPPKQEKTPKLSGVREEYDDKSNIVQFFKGRYFVGNELLSCKIWDSNVPIPIYISRYRRIVHKIDGSYYLNGEPIDPKQHNLQAAFFWDGILFKSDVLLKNFLDYYNNPLVADYLPSDLVHKVDQPIYDSDRRIYINPEDGKPYNAAKIHIKFTRYRFSFSAGVLYNKNKMPLKDFHKIWDKYEEIGVSKKESESSAPSVSTEKMLSRMSSMLKRRMRLEEDKRQKQILNQLTTYIDGHLSANSSE